MSNYTCECIECVRTFISNDPDADTCPHCLSLVQKYGSNKKVEKIQTKRKLSNYD